MRRFAGGIHPDYHKELSKLETIRIAPVPERLIVPMTKRYTFTVSPEIREPRCERFVRPVVQPAACAPRMIPPGR
ncbi:MAG TPA: hypothetical protein ENI27_04510 [bacterium]|nr:hypothetical protein [bacterium]